MFQKFYLNYNGCLSALKYLTNIECPAEIEMLISNQLNFVKIKQHD